MTGVLLTSGLGLALESYRSAIFWWLDPWSAEAPVLWMPTSRYPEQLRAAASRLDDCVAPGERIAVGADPQLGAAGLHWFLWLAYHMPAYDLQPLGWASAQVDAPEPEVLLLAGDRDTTGWSEVCRAHPVIAYRRAVVPDLSPPHSTQE